MRPFGSGLRSAWALDPDVTYLNHGTVGAPPLRVLQAQAALRDELERQPSAFLLRETAGLTGGPRTEPTRMRVAADAVARFVGARGADVVWVDNATTGANAVLGSLDLRVGDEILVTDHGYGAVVNAARYVARRAGASVRTVSLPYPRGVHPDAVLAAVVGALTPRTRMVVIDHVAAESALVLPVAEIAAACRARGVQVLVDGAHGPGAFALDVPALGADLYVANLHKWAWSPRSAGFLWARPELQASLHPPVISWGLDQGFTQEFDWVGTRDPTAWLAAPEGLTMLDELGRDAVFAHNHTLAWAAGQRLAVRWGGEVPAPESMIGTMVTVLLPERAGSTMVQATALRDALWFEDRIEVQVHATNGRIAVRVSAQVYVDERDVDHLGDAVARRIV